jgi:muconolactone delta-isomerase
VSLTGPPGFDIEQRESAEARASAELRGKLLRLWRPIVAAGEANAIGLFRVDSKGELEALLGALPLAEWMQAIVTPLETHPHDPASTRTRSFQLPDPRMSPVYRLEAALGTALRPVA